MNFRIVRLANFCRTEKIFLDNRPALWYNSFTAAKALRTTVCDAFALFFATRRIPHANTARTVRKQRV
jgi:hypothetical protein